MMRYFKEPKNVIRWVFLALVILGLSVGCNLVDSVSKRSRIDMFFADLTNARWSSLNVHLHPSTGIKSSADTAYWTSIFKAGETYGFKSYSEGGGNIVTLVVTGTDASHFDDMWTFTMQESDKDVWMIRRLETSDATITPIGGSAGVLIQ